MRALAWKRIAGCIAGGGAGNFHHTGRPYAMAGTLAGIVFMLVTLGNGAPQNSLKLPVDVVVGITLASVLLTLLLQLA